MFMFMINNCILVQLQRSIFIQVQERVIHSRISCWFKKLIFIQQNHIIRSGTRVSWPWRLSLFKNQVPGHRRQTHSTNLPVPTPADLKTLHIIHRGHSCQKGGQGIASEQLILNFFEDILSLLNVFEEEQNKILRPFVESVINRLESVGKFVENILQFVSDHKDELIGAAKNLRVMFLSWCRKLQEIKLRHSPNCTHLSDL